MNFTELPNGQVECFAVVKQSDKKVTSKGLSYLDIKLSDKTGDISAKLWDYKEDIHGEIPVDSFVKVRGTLSQYQGADQLRVERIRFVLPSDNVDINDYVQSADYTGEYMYSKILDRINAFSDEDIKKLVLHMYSERKEQILFWPAAYRLHHAVRGGLLMHTLSIVKLCEGICEVYPFVDKDLLIAGAILHDIAKTTEYNVGSSGLASGYTVEGNLIGHLVKGAMLVDEAAKQLGVPEEKAMLLEHMLISHHGEPDFGAAVRPMFLEAELLSELDLMDARVYQIKQSLEPVNKDGFSSRLWALEDRKMFNHGRSDLELKVNLD